MKNPNIILWASFFAVLILLASISLFAIIRGSNQMLSFTPEQNETLEITLDGKKYIIEPRLMDKIAPELQKSLSLKRQNSQYHIDKYIDSSLNRAFAESIQNTYHFGSWYYSLPAEYTRLAKALTGNMATYLTNKMKSLVFQNLDEHINDSIQSINLTLSDNINNHSKQIYQELATMLSKIQQPSNTPSTLNKVIFNNPMAIDQKLIQRQIVSGLSAVGVFAALTSGKTLGAVVVKQSISKIAGTKTFQLAAVLLAKFATKSAVKSGGALGAGASGVVICSPGGLLAVLCGSGAALITWVGVDQAFLKFDEHLNRQAFEKDIVISIIQQREALKMHLKKGYKEVIHQQYHNIFLQLSKQIQFKNNYIPAETIIKDTSTH